MRKSIFFFYSVVYRFLLEWTIFFRIYINFSYLKNARLLKAQQHYVMLLKQNGIANLIIVQILKIGVEMQSHSIIIGLQY